MNVSQPPITDRPHSHGIEDYRAAETGLQYSHLANGVYDACSTTLSDGINTLQPHTSEMFNCGLQVLFKTKSLSDTVCGIFYRCVFIAQPVRQVIKYFDKVLGLSHAALLTRDLALFRPFRKKLRSRSVISLSTLVHLFMGRNVGMDYENPVSHFYGFE
jgi:RNA exonuclease 4